MLTAGEADEAVFLYPPEIAFVRDILTPAFMVPAQG